MKSQISVLLTLIVLVLIASCGKNNPASGNDEDPPGPPTNPGITTKDIGPAGGSLTSKDGLLTLNIPAGALGQEESITIEKITADDLGTEFDELRDVIGTVYELGPDGLQFDEAINVTFESSQTPIQEEDSLSVNPEFLFTSSEGNLEILDSLRTIVDMDIGTIMVSGHLSHFSPLLPIQSNNGISFFIKNIPNQLEVGSFFTAKAVVTESGAGPLGDLVSVPGPAEYLDMSISPLNPAFGPGAVELFKDSDGSFTGNFDYECTNTGTGTLASEMSVNVIFTLDDVEIGAESYTELSKSVECIAQLFNLIIEVEGTGSGTVESFPEGIDCPEDCEESYSNGTDVILTAKAAEGSKFAGWDGDYGNNNVEDSVITLTMDQAKTVTAFFNKESSAAGILLQLRALPVVMTALESVSSPVFILSTLIQNIQNSGYGSNSFTLAEDRVPVLVQGAEGFIVFDLVTNDVLLDFTNVLGNNTTASGLRTPLGALAVSRPNPGPATASVIASYGLDDNNTAFGFSLYPWDKQESEYKRGPVYPYQTVIDAFPVGGGSISDEVVIVREGNGGINFLRYSEPTDAYQHRASRETLTINRYGSEPAVTAYGEEAEGALLVVNAIGDLYFETRIPLVPTVNIGNLGQRILRLRCDLPVCVATDFDGNAVSIITWDGQTEPTIVGSPVGVGVGPVDPDLYTLPNGDIVVAVTGFNDNTISILKVAGNGAVLSNILYEAPEGCINPGHVILEENSDDANNPLVIGTCYESDNYFVNDLENSGGLFPVIGGM